MTKALASQWKQVREILRDFLAYTVSQLRGILKWVKDNPEQAAKAFVIILAVVSGGDWHRLWDLQHLLG